MISTKNVIFSYVENQLFHFPDLHCLAENTILITGKSGTGKTTYLHLLAGLLQPKTGEIIINNTNITQLSEGKLDQFRGKHIGLVLQKSHFIRSLSVLENLEMASWITTKKKKTAKAKELLTLLNIANEANKKPDELSIGQQQRVSIARALINEPKIVLADEPTSSLDDDNAEKVIQLLVNLSKKYQAALLIVTHDSRIKEKFSNQITLL